MNEEGKTLDEIIDFYTFVCEVQKMIDEMNDNEGSEQYSESFEKHTRQVYDFDDKR